MGLENKLHEAGDHGYQKIHGAKEKLQDSYGYQTLVDGAGEHIK